MESVEVIWATKVIQASHLTQMNIFSISGSGDEGQDTVGGQMSPFPFWL